MNQRIDSPHARSAVTVNGDLHQLPAGASLAQLLATLGHAPQAVATAVDGEFVARNSRDTFVLRPGAKITCFQAIVGG